MRELAVAVMVVAVVGLVAVAPVSSAEHTENTGSDCVVHEEQDAIAIGGDDENQPEYWLDPEAPGTQPAHLYQETNGEDGLQVGGHGPAPGNAVSTGDEDVDGTAELANLAIYSEAPEHGYCGAGPDTLIL